MMYDSDDEFRTVFSAPPPKPVPTNQSIKLARSNEFNQNEIASQIERELSACENTHQLIDRLIVRLKTKPDSQRVNRLIDDARQQSINQSRRIHSLFQSHATLLQHQSNNQSNKQSFSQSISLSINQSRASLLESFMLYYQQYAACTDLIVQSINQSARLLANQSTSQPGNPTNRTIGTRRRSVTVTYPDDDDDDQSNQSVYQSDIDRLQLMVREVGLIMRNEQSSYNQSINQTINQRLSATQSSPTSSLQSNNQSINDLYHQTINRAISFTLTGAGLGAMIGGPLGAMIGAKSASGLGLASGLASGLSGLLLGGLTGTVASVVTQPSNTEVINQVNNQSNNQSINQARRPSTTPPTPLVPQSIKRSIGHSEDFDGPSRRRTQPVFSSLSVSPTRVVKPHETRNEWKRIG